MGGQKVKVHLSSPKKRFLNLYLKIIKPTVRYLQTIKDHFSHHSQGGPRWVILPRLSG